MNIGSVLRARTIRHVPQPQPDAPIQLSWADIAHPDKKMVAVVVLLGFERKDGTGDLVDPNAVMRAMGWVPAKESK